MQAPSDRAALFAGTKPSPRKNVSWAQQAGTENATNPVEDHDQLLQMRVEQDMLLDEQDAQLDVLSETLGRQHELGLRITDELTQHNVLLEQLDRDVSRTSGRVEDATRAIKKIAQNSSNRKMCLICTIVIVLLVLILVIILALR
eukprot:TRINITY_DN8224_c0_g1_i2.p1 TRINITY_DN8224_c0_g1~~TRINITY_DN8224_c0_g1_i2.p1  ORF type:complete len:145 (-),score=29.19 TRINITY_DN8224_c0_g1_i2:27-461(-)